MRFCDILVPFALKSVRERQSSACLKMKGFTSVIRIGWAGAAGKYGDVQLQLLLLGLHLQPVYITLKWDWIEDILSRRRTLSHLWGRPWPSSGSRQLLLQCRHCPMAWQFVVTAVLFSLSRVDLGLWSQMLAEGCNPTEKTLQGCVWCSLRCSSPKTANTNSSS